MSATSERSRADVMANDPQQERSNMAPPPLLKHSYHSQQHLNHGEYRERGSKRTPSCEEAREPRQRRRIQETEPLKMAQARDARVCYMFTYHDCSAFSRVQGRGSVSPSIALMPPPPPVPRPSPTQQAYSAKAGNAPEPSDRPSPPPRSSRLSVDDAMHFIKQVKKEFRDSPRIYKEFLAIMKQYRLHEIDTPTVVDCVSRLFRGRPHLIRGFNIFLPSDCQISVDNSGTREGVTSNAASPMSTLAAMASVQPSAVSDSSKDQEVGNATTDKPKKITVSGSTLTTNLLECFSEAQIKHSKVAIQHAIEFVQRVQERFSREEDRVTFHKFMIVLRKYQAKETGLAQVTSEISILFANHPDLVEGFVYFLPDHLRKRAQEQLRVASASGQLSRHSY